MAQAKPEAALSSIYAADKATAAALSTDARDKAIAAALSTDAADKATAATLSSIYAADKATAAALSAETQKAPSRSWGSTFSYYASYANPLAYGKKTEKEPVFEQADRKFGC